MSFTLPKKRKLKKVVSIIFVLYIINGLALYLFQESLLFRPSVLAQDYKYAFSHPFEELFLKTEDGETINAIHFKKENPKGVVIHFHGNRGNIDEWGQKSKLFLDRGYDVFVMDYRSYGKSTGVITETSFYSDALLCYNYVKSIYSENKITVYGRSLGTGFATYVASKNKPKQLVLESPYYEIADPAQHRIIIYPAKLFLNFELPTYKYIKNVISPITIIHGTDDYIIPYESAKKLYNIIPKDLKTFITIKDAKHSDLFKFDSYVKAIDALLL
ncbi:alpha/beta hydrolase [uncultured Lacinutrix sp.]|uniref:alpha/beta hydrolase n=1 Tax=uncultured Lacinutrix sp. TaxID=574032 RepID=UPI002623601C|nr:alpha/beta hydrolase [uncultured Lacinutrix sp.]